MVRIVFYKQEGTYWGFSESGHAGFAESGEDIVCAAISAMSMLVINTLEVAYATTVNYQIDEKTTDVRVSCKSALSEYENDEAKQFAVAGLFQGYYLQLMDMLEDYSDYLDISEEERDYGEF